MGKAKVSGRATGAWAAASIPWEPSRTRRTQAEKMCFMSDLHSGEREAAVHDWGPGNR